MTNKIELQNISHYFETPTERISLFDGLSLTVEGGTSHSIVGPSGAGKSSLLTLAAGLEEARQGTTEFTLDGKPTSALELRAKSGFIFQHFHLMPELDALSNLALPIRLKGNKNANDIAAEWLKKVGLENRSRHKPNQLSGGEQQRIAVARAFVSQPVFIFADEPTGNLDEKTSAGVAELMLEFAKTSNCALILVTHSRELAAQADYCHSLSHGTLEQIQ